MTETTQAVETAEKLYTLRPLEASDVFVMSKIIHAVGIEEFKKCFQPDIVKNMMEQDKGAEEVGFEVFFGIVGVITGNLPKCEKDIYKLLAGLSGMTEAQIKALPMNEFFEMIIEVIRKEEFKDFLLVVSKLFK